MFVILDDAFPFDINHFCASGHTDIFEMHIVNTRISCAQVGFHFFSS